MWGSRCVLVKVLCAFVVFTEPHGILYLISEHVNVCKLYPKIIFLVWIWIILPPPVWESRPETWSCLHKEISRGKERNHAPPSVISYHHGSLWSMDNEVADPAAWLLSGKRWLFILMEFQKEGNRHQLGLFTLGVSLARLCCFFGQTPVYLLLWRYFLDVINIYS